MPQIIFSDDERAEIERLVAEHSPSNHPHIARTLGLLQPDVRAGFVSEYETMLRTVAEVFGPTLKRGRPHGMGIHGAAR